MEKLLNSLRDAKGQPATWAKAGDMQRVLMALRGLDEVVTAGIR